MKKTVCVFLVCILLIGVFAGCSDKGYSKELDKAIEELKLRGNQGFNAELNTYGYNGKAYVKIKYTSGDMGVDYLDSLVIIGDNRKYVSMYADNKNGKVYSKDNYYLIEESGSLNFDVNQTLISMLSTMRDWNWDTTENKVNLVLKHKLSNEDISLLDSETDLSYYMKMLFGNSLTKAMLNGTTLVLTLDQKSNKLMYLSFDLTEVLKTAVDGGISDASLKINLTREMSVELNGSIITREVYDAMKAQEHSTSSEPIVEPTEPFIEPATEVNVPEETIVETIPVDTTPVETAYQNTTEETKSEESQPSFTMNPNEFTKYQPGEPADVTGLEFVLNDVKYNGFNIDSLTVQNNKWSILDFSDEIEFLSEGESGTLQFISDNNNGINYSTLGLTYIKQNEELILTAITVKCGFGDEMPYDLRFTGPHGFVNGISLSKLIDILGSAGMSKNGNIYSWNLEGAILDVYVSDEVGVYGFRLSR